MKEKAETDKAVVYSGAKRKTPHDYSKWGALSLGAIIIILIVLLITSNNAKVAFTINGEQYTVSGLNNFISSAKTHGLNKTTSKTDYISIRKDQYIENELSVSVSSSDVSTAAGSQFPLNPNQTLDDYENLVSWDTAFHNQILLMKTGGTQGAFLNFPFNNLFVKPAPGLPTPKDFGISADIMADQQYALKQANYYHDQLKAGSMSMATVLSALANDPRLIASNSGNGSYAFTVNKSGVSFLNQQYASTVLPSYVLSAINSLNGVGITNVLVNLYDGYIPSDVAGITLALPQPVAYYFVDVQSKIAANPNIDNQLKGDLNSLKVDING